MIPEVCDICNLTELSSQKWGNLLHIFVTIRQFFINFFYNKEARLMVQTPVRGRYRERKGTYIFWMDLAKVLGGTCHGPISYRLPTARIGNDVPGPIDT